MNSKDIKKGDVVKILKSPYSDVKVGTLAYVKKVIYNHFGRGQHLYELDLPDHKLFRIHEIENAADPNWHWLRP